MLVRLACAMCLFVAGVSAQALAGASAQPGTLVRPESLPQGFVLVVKDNSGQADDASPIYLASNNDGWDAGRQQNRFERRSDMRWQLVVPQPTINEPLQFKLTLGDWSRVEHDADGNDVPNRTLPMVEVSGLAQGELPVIELEVDRFRVPSPEQLLNLIVDPYRVLDVSGDVRRLEVSGGAGRAAAMSRQLLVWLPPGYDNPANADRVYPVLYMHDGQNLFERLPGVPSEWQMDETLTDLITSGRIPPMIVVGIPHAGPGRTQEYVPLPEFRGIEGAGDRYVVWLTEEVMPRVERAFRVSTEPRDTAIGGASLGAVISLYAAAQHPERFGALLLESMPTMAGYEGAWREVVASVQPVPSRVYVGMGEREVSNDEADADRNEAYRRWAEELASMLRGSNGDVRLVIGEGHNHNEQAWSARLPAALVFLFGEGR